MGIKACIMKFSTVLVRLQLITLEVKSLAETPAYADRNFNLLWLNAMARAVKS